MDQEESSLRLEAEEEEVRQSSPHIGSDELTRASALSCALRHDGYALTAARLLPPAACDVLRRRVLPSLFRGEFDTGVYPDEWHWREGLSLPRATREICNAWKSDRTVASVVLSEGMGRLVAEVTGWSSVRIAQDDVVWKVPRDRRTGANGTEKDGGDGGGSAVVGYHQDSAYISRQFVPYWNNSVTVWVALDDADAGNGCVEYAVGSHLWRPLLHMRERRADGGEKASPLPSPSSSIAGENEGLAAFHGSDGASYRDSLRRAAALSGAVGGFSVRPAEVGEGHAIFHHQDVWHGSGPNSSDTRHRRALVAHYLQGDVLFREDGGVDGGRKASPTPWGSSTYIYGRYKRHNSPVVDEDFFPIIYASAESSQRRTPWLDDYIVS